MGFILPQRRWWIGSPESFPSLRKTSRFIRRIGLYQVEHPCPLRSILPAQHVGEQSGASPHQAPERKILIRRSCVTSTGFLISAGCWRDTRRKARDSTALL